MEVLAEELADQVQISCDFHLSVIFTDVVINSEDVHKDEPLCLCVQQCKMIS